MAADRKDVEAGKAHVTLYVNESPMIKALQSIQSKFNAWGKQIMAIGAGISALGVGITSSFAGAVTLFTQAGSALQDVADRTGVAVDNLSELKYAAEQSGTSLETVEKALLKMGKEGLDPNDFDKVAARIAAMKDPARQIAAAMEVWGKSGAELIPMLAELQNLRKQARDLGVVLRPEDVALAAKLGDVWDQLFTVVKATVFNIGAALAPAILPIVKSLVKIAAITSKWVQENGELVRTIALIGVGLTVVGGAILGIGAGIVALGALIGGVSSLIALTLNPIGAVVVAVAAVGTAVAAAAAWWLVFTESGRKTARWLWEAFKPVFAFISNSLKGITNALTAGDFKLAGEIAAKSFEVAFLSAIDSIRNGLHDLTGELTEFFKNYGTWEMQTIARLKEAFDAARGYQPSNLAGQARSDLEMLQNTAADAAYQEQKKGSGSNDERLKSFGSFNATALALQNWGGVAAGGKKKVEDLMLTELKTLTGKLMPRLIRATEDIPMVYGD